VGISIAQRRVADYVGYRFPRVDRILESVSVLLVDDGKLPEDRMAKAHINEGRSSPSRARRTDSGA
jgi:uncharacterized membrane protein YcaP (DUF421 family)